MNKKKRGIDWEEIGPKIDQIYRAGSLSNSKLAKEVGISRQTLLNYIQRQGLTRDLKDKIAQRVDVVLNTGLAKARLTGNEGDAERDSIIVEEVAATHVEVVRSHRVDIRRLRDITNGLASKLENRVASGKEIVEVEGKEVEISLDLEKEAKTLNSLTNSMQKLIDLERMAFGIGKEGDTQAPTDVKSVMEIIFGKKEGLPGADA
ncbi:MAG: hypothetical protein ACKVJE_21895 [Pseudomonadales bacterium]